jgi:hypothetical protein
MLRQDKRINRKGNDMTPNKETVRAAYIAEIGYDCFENDDMMVQEAWEILQDHRAIAAEAAREYAGWRAMQSAMRDIW